MIQVILTYIVNVIIVFVFFPILESAVTSAMHISTILGAPIAFLGLKPNVNIAPELGY